jgi:hypothetical protein
MSTVDEVDKLPNGPGAAAILAAGIGCAAMGVFAFAGDAWEGIGKAMNVYNPVGALSGVSSLAIIVWIVAWLVLGRTWANRQVAMGPINLASFALLIVGFLLTFPPFMDLLQGK